MNKNATPLVSIEAVVIDTETTGLDATTARIVEIAALGLKGADIDPKAALDQLINPGEAVPEGASRLHGLTSEHLDAAPRFAAVAASLNEVIGDAVVIGHNIGYDLAVLDREHARAGLTWKLPRFLDIRALARLAAPDLASYSLDALCDWQSIRIERRHRALADARATADLFVRLVPLLRGHGIRTLAEAEHAVRVLPGETRLTEIGGWVSPARAASADTAPAIAGIDSYPYQHRVRDLRLQPATFLESSQPVRAAAEALLEASASGIAIVGSARAPLGYVTARDLLRAALGPSGLAATLGALPVSALPVVGEDEFLYRALGRLDRLGAEHLGVVSRKGDIIGTLSAADLLSHRVSAALILGDEVESAHTVADLGRAWAHVPDVAASCLREGVDAPRIANVVSAEIRALSARASVLAEQRMREAGKGPPPSAYAVMVLGSAGRGDSLLSADQDNAIVYASGGPGGAEDQWFAALGSHLADILNELGIAYCKGGVMAKNPGCRHSLAHWKVVVDDWIARALAEDVLAADIFFDGAPVAGDMALANALFDFAFERAHASSHFAAALAASARNWTAPLGLLGRFTTDGDGRLDLKRNGLLPIVTAARTLALKHAIRPTSTIGRLNEAKARAMIAGDLVDRAIGAYGGLMRMVLEQQIEDAHRGIPVSARVQVAPMTTGEKRWLKTAFKDIGELIGTVLNVC